jgi:GAF domain-containing protein
MNEEFSADIAAVRAIEGIDLVLERMCALTGMGFAAVARVTEDRWVALLVRDTISFGLAPGDELKLRTTICDEIRESGEGVMIDHVAEEPMWRLHPTPIMYGFQSYISMPIIRTDGSFFGTLCAIDPEPRIVSISTVVEAIKDMARSIAEALDARDAHISGN